MSKTKSRTTVGPLITKDKKVLTEEKDMAEELNSFFQRFLKEDLSQIPDPETEVVQRNMDPVRVCRGKDSKTNDGWEASTVKDMQNEIDNANHDDETKWLLPAYMADQPHLRK